MQASRTSFQARCTSFQTGRTSLQRPRTSREGRPQLLQHTRASMQTIRDRLNRLHVCNTAPRRAVPAGGRGRARCWRARQRRTLLMRRDGCGTTVTSPRISLGHPDRHRAGDVGECLGRRSWARASKNPIAAIGVGRMTRDHCGERRPREHQGGYGGTDSVTRPRGREEAPPCQPSLSREPRAT